MALAIVLGALLILTNAWWWARHRRADRLLARIREEARQREARLLADLERQRTGQDAVFNHMTEGMLILGADQRVHLFNRALQQLFGFNHDVRGRTLLEALHRYELDELADRARREGQALGLEMEVGDRNPRVLRVNATTFSDREGRETGIIMVFHDVSRVKELENTRREFVANVSHELRTPLSLIKGYVETLLDGARTDPEVTVRFLQTIEKHANRLAFLIEDLLIISQLESRQLVMNFQSGPLRPLVVRVLEDFSSRAAARDIQLLNEVPRDITLRADFARLQQVLFNLVDNAIKYGRVGGHVSIRAATRGSPARLEILVIDDGPGIPPESLERIFERFYRVDAARSREEGGTGLGLSIVKHIVHAHGGDVRAESQPGKGATFRLTFPVPDAIEVAPPGARQNS